MKHEGNTCIQHQKVPETAGIKCPPKIRLDNKSKFKLCKHSLIFFTQVYYLICLVFTTLFAVYSTAVRPLGHSLTTRKYNTHKIVCKR